MWGELCVVCRNDLCVCVVCRYYSIEIEYFMSSLASDVMGILTENFLWMRTLGSTPILESEVLGSI